MKSYFITDPSFYNSLKEFKNYLTSIYTNHKVDFSCYRDKVSFSKEFAKIFLDISKSFGIKNILLNFYIDTAKELGFDGVHLTSTQYYDIKYAKKLQLFTIVSSHDFKDIENIKEFGADAITFSPIFYTPHKGVPKGVDMLNQAVLLAKPMKCFALGGIISQKEITECEKAGAYGFASIRYFTVK